MCRDESITKRTQHPLLPAPQDSPASQFWEMMLKCYPNTFAKCCIIDHSFPHSQADNWVLRRPFLPFRPATQVTFLVSWTEMAFSRDGEQRASGRIGALLGQVSWNPTFLLQPEEKSKSNSPPKSVFSTSKVNRIITNKSFGSRKPFCRPRIQNEKARICPIWIKCHEEQENKRIKTICVMHSHPKHLLSCHVMAFWRRFKKVSVCLKGTVKASL